MSQMSGNFGSRRKNPWPKKFSSNRYDGKRPVISHDFDPRFNLNGGNRLGMAHGWQYHGQRTNNETYYSSPQPSRFGLSSPDLRSFEELQVERSYLINTLQREDVKATELLKEIRHLQDSCHDALEGPVHRKLKKQLGHYKNRMCQCTKQEKTILARLGQVTYEIQSKERWSRIENERIQQWNCQGFEQMRLDSTRPEFVPHNEYSQEWPAQALRGDDYYGEYSKAVPSYAAVPEWYPPTNNGPPNEAQESPAVVRSLITPRLRSASTSNLTVPIEKVKRLSMPELSTGDSEESDSHEGDYEYMGYYVSKPSQ